MGRFHYYEKRVERGARCHFCKGDIPAGSMATAVASFGEPFCFERCARAQVRDDS